MSFLNPIMLAGLAAISVPIIIHLLNRRKFQKVVWAAMRFLKISVEQNQRRMKIEDLILLALRCLLLALLALALARPAILSNAADHFGQSKVTGIIILDNSYSMGMSDGTQTRFDKARQAAEQVLDSMPGGSSTAVWLVSDTVQEVIALPTFDLNLARKTIREARLSDRATDLFPAIEKAVDYLQSRMAMRKEVFLITDGQAAGWRQLTEVQNTLEKSKNSVKTHIIFANEHEERNLGVSDLRLASGLAPVNQPLRFEVKVTNYGKAEARDIRVSLSVNGEPSCDEFTIDAIPPGASRSVSLFAKLRSEGFHALTARIPADRLPADDYRTIAVRAIKEVRVLLVDGEAASEPRESETYFLRNALVPVPPELAPDYFIKTATITAPELTQARLDDFDAIILANVPDLSENTAKGIEQYLRRGGGLMIFPGAGINVAFYNDELFTHYKFLSAALGPARGQADQDDKFFTLQDKDLQHPVVSIWNDPGSGTLSSVRFYRAFELRAPPAPTAVELRSADFSPLRSPLQKTGEERTKVRAPLSTSSLNSLAVSSGPQEAGDPQVILKFADGTPAIMERTWGQGRVMLFSSTANSSWNDWPVRLSFVPFIHRALGSMVQRQDEGLNIRVGDKFARRVSAELLDKEAILFQPKQADPARELRRIELVKGWPTLQYDRTDLGGEYDVSVVDPPFALKFAAQPAPYESSLDELSPTQVNLLKTVANILPWTPNLSLKGLVEKDRTGLEFWLPIVVAVLLLAGLETFLGQWFSRAK